MTDCKAACSVYSGSAFPHTAPAGISRLLRVGTFSRQIKLQKGLWRTASHAPPTMMQLKAILPSKQNHQRRPVKGREGLRNFLKNCFGEWFAPYQCDLFSVPCSPVAILHPGKEQRVGCSPGASPSILPIDSLELLD